MRSICNYAAVIAVIMAISAAQARAQTLISISESSLDFGIVELYGDIGSDIISVTNIANEDIIISASITSGAEFTTDWFGFVLISEGCTAEIDVNVFFDPVSNGDATGVLRIEVLVDDGTGGAILGEEVFVDLMGTGGPTTDPIDLIDGILGSFDQSIADGTLVSTGNNPNQRYRALRNRIRAIGFLIDQGYFDQASNLTGTAIERTDGAPNPKDFVAGSDLQELNDQLVLLKLLLDS